MGENTDQTSILAAPWPTPISALSASLIGNCGSARFVVPFEAMLEANRAERQRRDAGSAWDVDSRRPNEPTIARGRASVRVRRLRTEGREVAVHA